MAVDESSPSATAGTPGEPSLFEIAPLWCLDSNILLSFFREEDDEPYSRNLMPDLWRVLNSDINSGLIVAPPQVRAELDRARKQLPDLAHWLDTHRGLFVDLDDEALAWAKKIVNTFPMYAKDLNYLGDLCVIALAGARELTVISNEQPAKGARSAKRPKLPDVCSDFGIQCATFVGYLRRRTAGA